LSRALADAIAEGVETPGERPRHAEEAGRGRK
jgi:hypothetical protein